MTDDQNTAVQRAFDVLQPHVGRSATIATAVIGELDVDRYDIAIGCTDQPTRVGDGHRILPLLYLTSVLGWKAGPSEADLGSDGLDPAVTAGLPETGLRFMGAGQELTVHRTGRAGRSVRIESTVESVQIKKGRTQPFILVSILRCYSDADGQLFDCREKFVVR